MEQLPITQSGDIDQGTSSLEQVQNFGLSQLNKKYRQLFGGFTSLPQLPLNRCINVGGEETCGRVSEGMSMQQLNAHGWPESADLGSQDPPTWKEGPRVWAPASAQTAIKHPQSPSPQT